MVPTFIIITSMNDAGATQNVDGKTKLCIPTSFIQAVAPQAVDPVDAMIEKLVKPVGNTVITLHNLRTISCEETFEQITSLLEARECSPLPEGESNDVTLVRSTLN